MPHFSANRSRPAPAGGAPAGGGSVANAAPAPSASTPSSGETCSLTRNRIGLSIVALLAVGRRPYAALAGSQDAVRIQSILHTLVQAPQCFVIEIVGTRNQVHEFD